jgi:hypothetical protein
MNSQFVSGKWEFIPILDGMSQEFEIFADGSPAKIGA